MTIVELFSAEPAENLLSALCLRPERVIFLGSQSMMTDGRIAAIRAFFRGRAEAPALRFLRVGDRDYAGAGAAIRDIRKEHPDACFEMTGGTLFSLLHKGREGHPLLCRCRHRQSPCLRRNDGSPTPRR